ncbi:flagellar hook-associated protein FlgK [Jiella sp. MQZ9-1]|uniref:Flagellar hook-associated protein 1 n=1 Tax=Jiella flava TaxID=2816857 RepID=A0A939FTF8_9HYPH|nr:flagellar hook-associated protein FlgK [Jiella flava]MBO0661242.1 flagellar hook-associated protein FlgK [Jiella flava]MCD2469887.1 flagellar hook-associated protein FlgK [Jiella flava]
MSLLSAFNSARSSLATVSQQSALVSRNVANAQNTSATRKYANLTSPNYGGVSIQSVSQSSNQALFRALTSANSALGASQATKGALDSIRDVIGDTDSILSPATRLSKLKAALEQYAVTPEDPQAARAAINAASDLATSLNSATTAVQKARSDADTQLADAASQMNSLLKQFEKLNGQIVAGTATGQDVTDQVDRRDQIVDQLSNYVGLNVQVRAGNDMTLYTDSGITLFETTARQVEFTPKSNYDATVTGNSFKIDGVDVAGSSAGMPVKSGTIYGLLNLRDNTAVAFQGQLDETANALVKAFSETDSSGASYSGLFSVKADGSSTDLSTITSKTGFAGLLRVSSAAVADPNLLRDGNISGQGIVYNTDGTAGFAGRLNDLTDGLDAEQTFDGSYGAGDSGTIGNYIAASVGWLEDKRSTAHNDAEYQETVQSRAKEALSNVTGINIDEEMSHLLDLERSYQASGKLISTVGDMIDSILKIT